MSEAPEDDVEQTFWNTMVTSIIIGVVVLVIFCICIPCLFFYICVRYNNKRKKENEPFNQGKFCTFAIRFLSCGLIGPGRFCCHRFQSVKHEEKIFNQATYSSGESDSEFSTPFSDLSTSEKQIRILFLWKKLFSRLRGASLLIKKSLFQRKKISLYGVMKDGGTAQDDNPEEEKVNIRDAKCIIPPNNKVIMRWNLWVSALLIYTAIAVPIKVSFEEKATIAGIIFDTCIDACFLFDIGLQFFLAFERRDGNIEVRKWEIAKRYFKIWFWIDIFSSLPFQLIELFDTGGSSQKGGTEHMKWLRIFRLAKLQRMVRLLRLLKLVRLLKQSKQMKAISQFFSMTSGARQLVTIFISILFTTHLIGCFWFLMAKEWGFHPDCWVVRQGIENADIGMQYLQSIYWAFQTLTTVGFGDINGKTMEERIFAIGWMLVGIGFYSIMFGNMTNLLDSMDAANKSFQEKISVLKEFRKRTNINQRLFTKIKRHLETNQKSANNFQDQEQLLSDLPQSLRQLVIECTHGEIIERIDFFKDKQQDFLLATLQHLKPLKLLIGDILYQQGDHAEEIYLIKIGKIKLQVDIYDLLPADEDNEAIWANANGEDDGGVESMPAAQQMFVPFIAYIEGSYFGDTDIFQSGRHLERDSTAKADQECHFFVLSRTVIDDLKRTFDSEIKEMESLAQKRQRKHKRLINKLSMKVHAIKENKERLGGKVDYETNLLIMEDFNMDESNYSTDEQIDSGKGGAYPAEGTNEVLKDGETDDKEAALTNNVPESEKEKQNLLEQQKKFLYNFQDTLTYFQKTISVIETEADQMGRLCDDIQQLERNKGETSVSTHSLKSAVAPNNPIHMARLKSMSDMLEEIINNNQVSQKSIQALLKQVK